MNDVIEPRYFRSTANPLLGADETPLSFAIDPTPAAVAATAPGRATG